MSAVNGSAQSLYCHWCDVRMLSSGQCKATHPRRRTVDHVKCKAECALRSEYISPQNKVWACWACNQKRNDDFLRAFPRPSDQKPKWQNPTKRHGLPLVRTKTGEIENVLSSHFSLANNR